MHKWRILFSNQFCHQPFSQETLNTVFLPEKSRRGKRAEKMRTQLKVAAASGGGGSAVPDWWLGPNWGLLLLCRRSSTTIAQLSDQLEVTCVV